MSPSSLDANVVLRVILNDVPDQAERAARYLDRSPCYVTDVVIAECVFVLEKTYKLDRVFITTSLSSLFELKTLSYNEAIITEALDLYGSLRTLSFADCYSVAEAMLNENRLITFDRAILKKCGSTADQPE